MKSLEHTVFTSIGIKRNAVGMFGLVPEPTVTVEGIEDEEFTLNQLRRQSKQVRKLKSNL